MKYFLYYIFWILLKIVKCAIECDDYTGKVLFDGMCAYNIELTNYALNQLQQDFKY